MKRWLLTLLTVCLMAGLSVPAYAAESGDDPDMTGQQEETQVQEPQEPTQEEQQPEDQQEPQDSPVVVGTLEELQAALDAAEDGDTLYLSKKILLKNISLSCDKNITIRGTGPNSCLFLLSGNCELSGFNFITDYRDLSIAIIDNSGLSVGNTKISDCQFSGNRNYYTYLINIFSGNVEFQNCTFQSSAHTAMNINTDSAVVIQDCLFGGTQTLYIGGAICNYGDLTIYNTEIVNNASGKGGAIYNAGLLTISSSTIKGNTGKNEFDIVEGNDIYSCGVLTITDEQPDGAGFYEETTGEKLILPLVGYTDTARLTYLTDEQAAEYFAPEPPKEEEPIPPEPGDDGGNTPPEQPQPPQEAGDQTGEDDTTGGEQPPQEPTQPPEGDNNDNPDNGEQEQPQEPVQPPQDDPTEPPTEPVQPPEGEGKDDPTDNQPEAPEQPIEPPQSDSKDDPTDTPIATPDTPQQPTDSGDSEDDDYTPPVSHRPAHRPSTPVATPIKPTPTPEPEDKPKLSCGGAVIDTSRTIVLLGYGDGLQHEEDPLTRAQLATIIYRLLDDESIALYSNAALSFTDVPADAWYAPYVQAINSAGIVYGVGGGRYDPEGVVNWAQIITILSRFVEQQEYKLQHIQYDGWAVEAIQTAVALGWIEDSADFNPDAVISRGELVQLVNGVLAMYR